MFILLLVFIYFDYCIISFLDLIYLSCQVNKELINIYEERISKRLFEVRDFFTVNFSVSLLHDKEQILTVNILNTTARQEASPH